MVWNLWNIIKDICMGSVKDKMSLVLLLFTSKTGYPAKRWSNFYYLLLFLFVCKWSFNLANLSESKQHGRNLGISLVLNCSYFLCSLNQPLQHIRFLSMNHHGLGLVMSQPTKVLPSWTSFLSSALAGKMWISLSLIPSGQGLRVHLTGMFFIHVSHWISIEKQHCVCSERMFVYLNRKFWNKSIVEFLSEVSVQPKQWENPEDEVCSIIARTFHTISLSILYMCHLYLHL